MRFGPLSVERRFEGSVLLEAMGECKYGRANFAAKRIERARARAETAENHKGGREVRQDSVMQYAE